MMAQALVQAVPGDCGGACPMMMLFSLLLVVVVVEMVMMVVLVVFAAPLQGVVQGRTHQLRCTVPPAAMAPGSLCQRNHRIHSAGKSKRAPVANRCNGVSFSILQAKEGTHISSYTRLPISGQC